jgi:hypothetical protein
MRRFLFLFLIFCGGLSAGTVRMINDSPYILRAVIRGNDGTYLAEQVIQPQNTGTWTDAFGQIGSYGRGHVYTEDSSRTQTPYTVLWYCMAGGAYSICNYVATGSTVFAQSGEGERICSPDHQRKGPGAYPNQPQQGYLHQQAEPEAYEPE